MRLFILIFIFHPVYIYWDWFQIFCTFFNVYQILYRLSVRPIQFNELFNRTITLTFRWLLFTIVKYKDGRYCFSNKSMCLICFSKYNIAEKLTMHDAPNWDNILSNSVCIWNTLDRSCCRFNTSLPVQLVFSILEIVLCKIKTGTEQRYIIIYYCWQSYHCFLVFSLI